MPPIARWAAIGAAAEICGTTPKTVKRSVLAAQAAEKGETPVVEHNYDAVRDVVIERVERTKGKITAKRLLAIAQAAGYEGSPRNFRRLVAEVKAEWRAKNHRGRRPGVWSPGDMLVFDWGRSVSCSSSAPCWRGPGSASCTSPTISVRRRP